MPARRKIDRDEFARLDAADWPLSKLAEHFGVNVTTASRVRRELGLNRKHFLTAERLAKIEAMLDDGWSFHEIHRTEGTDMETLRRHFPGRGWTLAQSVDYRRSLRWHEEAMNKAAYVLPNTDLRKSPNVS